MAMDKGGVLPELDFDMGEEDPENELGMELYKLREADNLSISCKTSKTRNLGGRAMHLRKRGNGLEHKLKKLQMCQFARHVGYHLALDKDSHSMTTGLQLLKKKSQSLMASCDSDVTDSSSDEDVQEWTPIKITTESIIQKPSTDKNISEHRLDKNDLLNQYTLKMSNACYKWQWLQFQIHCLEFKILQTNDILRRVRTQEPRSEFDEVPFALSQDGTTEETQSSARVRGLRNASRKKLASTLSIVTQSHNSLPLSGTPCACPPNTCCIICGGPGVLHLRHPDRSCHTCKERIDMLYSKYHPVLSFDSIPLSAQYGRLIKDKRFSTKAVVETPLKKSENLSLKKPASREKNNNQLQKLLQVKKKTRQVAENKKLDHERRKSSKENIQKQSKEKTGPKSLTSSRASSPASSTGTEKKKTTPKPDGQDKPYMPDLSESSSSDSESEAKIWNPSPSKIQKLQDQRQKNSSQPINLKRIQSNLENHSHNGLPENRAVTRSNSIADVQQSGSNNAGATASITAGASSKKPLGTLAESTDSREEIVIPLSNSLPLFEPIVYKTIETPQWRTKWFDPLPLKNVGRSQQGQVEDMSIEQYSRIHEKYEHEERIKLAGLHRGSGSGADLHIAHLSKQDPRKDASEFESLGRPYEKRDFPLTQRQLLDVNQTTVVPRNHDFFEVL